MKIEDAVFQCHANIRCDTIEGDQLRIRYADGELCISTVCQNKLGIK